MRLHATMAGHTSCKVQAHHARGEECTEWGEGKCGEAGSHDDTGSYAIHRINVIQLVNP